MGFGGWLGFCAKPLLIAMNSVHDATTLGYGWVIVLITLLPIFWMVDGCWTGTAILSPVSGSICGPLAPATIRSPVFGSICGVGIRLAPISRL